MRFFEISDGQSYILTVLDDLLALTAFGSGYPFSN